MIVKGPSGEKIIVVMLGEQVDDINKQMLIVALENNSGNQSRAAQSLGIHPRTIRHWLNRYGINEADPTHAD